MLKEKMKAVMLGHAVADALGVPVEFCERAELQAKPVLDMMGYGTYPYPAGCWSDDTSMSLAALDSLASGTLNYDDVMLKFGKWYYEDGYTPTGELFDVGNICSFAIENYCVSHKPVDACGIDGERSNGNGSLMRIHPFVLYATETFLDGSDDGHRKWMDCIQRGSALTHAHDRSAMGCYIYGYCLRYLLKEASRASLIAGLELAGKELAQLPEFERYGRIFDPDFDKLAVAEIKSTGYVVDTLEAALWCVLTTDNYRDCVLKAVNLGDDTDTVAAVAGGIAGALYGYGAIPTAWLNTLKRRDYIEEMCERASAAWTRARESE